MSHAEIIHLNRESLEVQKQHLRDAELCSDDPILFEFYMMLVYNAQISARKFVSKLPTSVHVTTGAMP